MQATYVFAEFELDGARFELRRAGKRVAIQPKELRLLLYLVMNIGRVASSRELLEALWPQETVCAGSLKRAVRGARRALGDDGTSQSRIRTVRGYGYEFVDRITEVVPYPGAFRLLSRYPQYSSLNGGRRERATSAAPRATASIGAFGESDGAASAPFALDGVPGSYSEPSEGVGS